jgi:hypothetical protein
MIRDTAKFHGAALVSLIEGVDVGVTIRKIYPDNSGFYILNERLPLFLKYATKRSSPWSFTFHTDHLIRYQALTADFGECLMILICGYDGIVSLCCSEMGSIVHINQKTQKRVSITRKLNTMYFVSGTDGVIDKRISKNSLIDTVKTRLFKDDVRK